VSCHPFDHVWSYDSDAGAERCIECHCLGELNDNNFMVTIKCYTCGAWASHERDGGYYCHRHKYKKAPGLRGAVLED